MKQKTVYILCLIMALLSQTMECNAATDYQPHFSTAGFFEIAGTERNAYSMNPAWRMHKGHVDGAENVNFDDSSWKLTSLPDGIENLPMEASGCVNYQGEVWYRKTLQCRCCMERPATGALL